MANPLRNAMVYLGLAEEQEQEQAQQQARERATPAAAPTDRVEPVVEQDRPAPVTPINKSVKPMPTPTPVPVQAPVGAMNEILTVHPKAYDKDAQLIAETFRDGVPVIMNLSQMTDSDARRIIDFASGLTQGVNGKIERVTNRVFLLTPEHVNVHGEDQSSQDDPTFFA